MLINNKVLGMLGISAKAGKVLSGTDVVLDGIKRRKVKLVIVAEDAAERTVKNMTLACGEYVTIKRFGKIDERRKGRPCFYRSSLWNEKRKRGCPK